MEEICAENRVDGQADEEITYKYMYFVLVLPIGDKKRLYHKNPLANIYFHGFSFYTSTVDTLATELKSVTR